MEAGYGGGNQHSWLDHDTEVENMCIPLIAVPYLSPPSSRLFRSRHTDENRRNKRSTSRSRDAEIKTAQSKNSKNGTLNKKQTRSHAPSFPLIHPLTHHPVSFFRSTLGQQNNTLEPHVQSSNSAKKKEQKWYSSVKNKTQTRSHAPSFNLIHPVSFFYSALSQHNNTVGPNVPARSSGMQSWKGQIYITQNYYSIRLCFSHSFYVCTDCVRIFLLKFLPSPIPSPIVFLLLLLLLVV